MRYPKAFTLLLEPILVRLDPPDVIVVEGLPVGTLRFSRAQVRQCRPMRVAYYREHFDASYVPPCEGEILVLLSIEGVYDGKLGPFPQVDGMSVAESVNFACEDLLYASPYLCLHVSADGASVLMSHRRSPESISVTVPLGIVDVLELAVRDEPLDATFGLDTGFRPERDPRWIALVRAAGSPQVVGPFTVRSAATISRAFAEWRAEHPIDVTPRDVTEEELRADPTHFHLRRVRVSAAWYHAFECSSLAGAWLSVPQDLRFAYGAGRVVVVGTWVYPSADATTDYGHLGGSPGELVAETIELVDPAGELRPLQPNEPRSMLVRRAIEPLTRAHTRWRLDQQLEHEVAAAQTSGEPLAVLWLDLDHLASVNGSFGHPTGDAVLREVAARLRARLRSRDFLARYGGDEFVLLLPATDLAQAVALAAALRADIASRAIVHDGASVTITASVGVELVDLGEPDPGLSIGRARSRADDAKSSGGDRLASGAS